MNNLSRAPYKINSTLSPIDWTTEYNSKFILVENNTPISNRWNKIQIKKPFSQYKIV